MTDPGREPYGYDRRRRLSTEDRQRLYARSGGLCENCGAELDATWHGAHGVAYIHGGATQAGEMRAQCPKCNLRFGPGVMEGMGGFQPRLWQQIAFRKILLQLWEKGSATLHAAPGAGKTLFAATLLRHLLGLGYVERVVIFVPNTNLIGQTVDDYAKIGVHLDGKPRDSTIEHPQTVGLVICYQSLSEGAVEAHVTEMLRARTLVIFDEVHHLAGGEGDDSAWGRHVETMVGKIADGPPANAAFVLNMTGTLFRSKTTQRIATVRYTRIADDKWQAEPDYSVTTSELIGTELRAPHLYVYGSHVKIVDLEEEKVISAEIVDLSQRQRSIAAKEMFRSDQWLMAYCKEGIRLLNTQLEAVRQQVPLKLLHVADDQDSAAKAVKLYDDIAGWHIAVPVYSDAPGSVKRLKAVRSDPRPRVLVTCQMVTEGFDCKDLVVLVHATRKTAPLFIAQVMARVMRVTDHERAVGMMLPAQVLIPDSPLLRDAYAAAIATTMHVVEDGQIERCHNDHPRNVCPCLYPQTECLCGIATRTPGLGRYDVLSVDDPRLDGATVLGHLDGHVPIAELDPVIAECRRLSIPEPFAPPIAVLIRRSGGSTARPSGVTATATAPRPQPEPEPANPRDLSDTYRARLRTAAGFMQKHIRHDATFRSVEDFQAKINGSAGIRPGGRDQARVQQLSAASRWAASAVRHHCETHGEVVPEWAGG